MNDANEIEADNTVGTVEEDNSIAEAEGKEVFVSQESDFAELFHNIVTVMS